MTLDKPSPVSGRRGHDSAFRCGAVEQAVGNTHCDVLMEAADGLGAKEEFGVYIHPAAGTCSPGRDFMEEVLLTSPPLQLWVPAHTFQEMLMNGYACVHWWQGVTSASRGGGHCPGRDDHRCVMSTSLSSPSAHCYGDTLQRTPTPNTLTQAGRVDRLLRPL